MSRQRLRAVLFASGALLVALGSIGAEIVLASKEDTYERHLHPRRAAIARLNRGGCQRSSTVRVEWRCGKQLVWINPDGSKVILGTINDMGPVVHPRPAPTP